MSTETMGISLPDDAEVFRFPQSYKIQGIIRVIFGTATAGGSLVVLLTACSLLEVGVGGALGLAVGALSVIYGRHIWRRAGDAVAVNDGGIWYLSPREASLFLPWCDVVAVTTDRLTVTDGAGRKVAISHKIKNFQALRAYILQHAVLPESGFADDQIFSCARYPIFVVGMVSATLVILARGFWREGFGFLGVPVAFLASSGDLGNRALSREIREV